MSGLVTGVSNVLILICGIAMLLAFYRVLRGPSLPDRVVALDLLATAAVGVLGISALRSGLVAPS